MNMFREIDIREANIMSRHQLSLYSAGRSVLGKMLLLCFVLLPFAVAIGEEQGGAAPGIREQFEQKISGLAGVPVSVKDYRISYTTVTLTGVKIGETKKSEMPSLSIREISASCDLMSLLGGNLVLREITVASFTGRLTLDASGRPITPRKGEQTAKSVPTLVEDLPFRKITFNDIDLKILSSTGAGSLMLKVPSLNLDKSATASELLFNLAGTFEASVVQKPRTRNAEDAVSSWRFKINGKHSDRQTSADVGLTDGTLIDPVRRLDLKQVSIDLKAVYSAAASSLSGSLRVPLFQIDLPVSTTNRSSYVFPFKNVHAGFNWSGGVLTVSNAGAELFGGDLSGSGKVYPDKSPVRLQVNARGSNLKSELFLAQNTTQKQVVSGPFSGTFNAAGDIESLSSWNGNGSLNMKGGRYNAPPVVTPILSLVNLKEFAAGDITDASATFALKDGMMTTNDMVFLSTAGRADYRGDVGLDTSLRGNLNISFAPVAVAKSRVLQQISLDGKTASIPSRVEGTLLAPIFPGFKPEKLLELGLRRQGQKLLQDILKPRSKEPASTEPAPTTKKSDPARDLLKDLGNIFKRRR